MTQVKSLSELRKSRGASLESLQKQVETMTKKGGNKEKDEDPNMWQCKVDDAGNGSAVIRFLPACKTEDIPFVQLFSHGFKGPSGKWYIENSLTTIKLEDPVMKLNNSLWDTKDKDKIEIAKGQKRKTAYYANVLVIKDPANPENEGKVKIFRFNVTIFNMIQAKMKKEDVDPELADEVEVADPFNPFNFWDGASFSLKIKQKDKFANFDDSRFLKPKPIAADDEDIEAIWDQCHPLQPLVAADKFKTYEELEKRLHFVLGVAGAETKKAEQTELDSDDEEFIAQAAASSAKAKEKANAKAKAEAAAIAAELEAEDEPPAKPAAKKAAAKVAEVTKIDPADLPDAGGADGTDDPDLDYFRQLAGD